MNDSILSDNFKSESFKDENEETGCQSSLYYNKGAESFTIARQELSHNCFKDNIIIELENDLACMKVRFTESINLFHNRKSAYIRGGETEGNLRNSSVVSVNCIGTNENGKEGEFLKKELEEAEEFIENLKKEHAAIIAELKAHIKNSELVLEDTLNELGAAQDLLELKEIDITQLNKRIKDSDKMMLHLKDEIESLKKAIKKKEMVESDLLLSEEKCRQISVKNVELNGLLKVKEEELLKLKDKDKRAHVTPKIKRKHFEGPKGDLFELSNKKIKLRSTHKSLLEDLLNVEDEQENNFSYKTQPKLERYRRLPSNNKMFYSVGNSHNNTEAIAFTNTDFNEMLDNEDDYINLICNKEVVTSSKYTICVVNSFFIAAQIQYAASRRLTMLGQLQRNSVNQSSYLSAIYPLQLESMNSLIKYLNKDLEDLRSENETLRINYENKILELEENYLMKLSTTRSKSVCTTRSTK